MVNTYLILSWAFFLVSVICALMITSVKHPITRKYRKILISTAVSGMILGVGTWFMPLVLRKVNPIQSKKIALDHLPITAWEEPVENPITILDPTFDEMAWMKKVPEDKKFKFKFKLRLENDFQKLLTIQENEFVYLDQDGNIRGFDPYSALNHWKIKTNIKSIISQVVGQKRLFLIDSPKNENLRVSCIDLQTPSVLWQRMIPESKEGAAVFDFETQSLIVSSASDGIWSLKSKTGEILWKKPEIFSKTKVLLAGKNFLAFEPPVGKKVGAWYFLDPLTGAVIQKQNHIYPEMENFTPFSTTDGLRVLAQINAKQYFLLNPTDLNVIWSQTSMDEIIKINIIDDHGFLVAYENKILEKRDLKTGDLIWQKKMNQVDLKSFKIDPNQNLLVAPTADSDDREGTAFYSLEDGNYLFTAQMAENAVAVDFFGDWIYLMSETFVWAFNLSNPKQPTSAPQ